MNHKEIIVFAPLWKKIPTQGYGGIEKTTLERVKNLRKIGYKVQFVANTDDQNIADEIISISKVFKFPKSRTDDLTWFLLFKWADYLSSFSRLSKRLWNAPIISDASSMDPFSNYFLANSLGKERMLYYLHGNYYFTNGIGGRFFYPLDKFISASWKVNYGGLNKCISNMLASRGIKSYYMPNGMVFPDISIARNDNDGYLLFVGIITKYKAPHYAIQIAKKLHLPLKIVGPIGDRVYFDTYVKGHIGDNIEYLGEIPRNSLNELFLGAKALLFTSDWNDPQPAVVLEALSSGVPVLALNKPYCSGLYDMIENFENGYVGTMEEVIENASSIFEIDRKSIYRKSLEKWSWDRILKTYHIPVIERLYRNLNIW